MSRILKDSRMNYPKIVYAFAITVRKLRIFLCLHYHNSNEHIKPTYFHQHREIRMYAELESRAYKVEQTILGTQSHKIPSTH